MTIARPATPADIPAITRIYAESVLHGTASFELTPPDEAEMARRMRELTETGFPYLAAEANGELAGYAYAALYRTRPAYRWTVEDSVYISPAHQRGGRQMIAVIGDSPNQAGSVGLHRALGFAHVGIVHDVGFKHGHWRDTLLMQRVLGEGGTTKPRS